MKRKIFAAIFLSGLYATAFAANESPEEVVKHYLESYNKGDINGVMETFSQDPTVFTASSEQVLAGRQQVENYFKKSFEATKTRNASLPPQPDYQDYGNVAIRSAVSMLDMTTSDGKAMSFPIRSTVVLKNENGGWHIVHMHVSQMPKSK